MIHDLLKTSKTHPLRIDCVESPYMKGVIGMTLCPGRRGPSYGGGRWERDLDTDLEAVRAWQPTVVIALLEAREYAMLEIPQFQAATIEAGLPWLSLPIPDGGVPDAEFSETWRRVGPDIRNGLRRGGRVLIHCKAGLGRTGMLAAALLVELGAAPQDAITRVRASRANTIERPQEDYVRARRALAP
jgi:protein-tyrosine phosphatase